MKNKKYDLNKKTLYSFIYDVAKLWTDLSRKVSTAKSELALFIDPDSLTL